MDQPGWMTFAFKEMGEREIRGSKDNPAIMKLFKDAGHRGIKHDEVPWCAAYVGACLERAGIKSTRSLMARSYLKWGVALDKPRVGAIAVLRRGKNPTYGHVGFVVRATRGSLYLLGGNQSDAVNVKRYSRSRLLGFRWPQEDKAEADQEVNLEVKEEKASVERISAPDAVLSDGAVFERALTHVLQMEGGFDDDPYDPGGATNFGITISAFSRHKGIRLTKRNKARLVAQLKRISPKTVRQIYLERYWQRAHCERFLPALAVMHFDCAVNQGVGRAIRFLQLSVGADADGEIGPQTMAAVRQSKVVDLVAQYGDLRRRHYRSLGHFWRFGKGWLRRVDKTEALCAQILAEQGSSEMVIADQSEVNMEQNDMNRTSAKRGEPGVNQTEVPAADKKILPRVKTKWWGESLTIWGALLGAISTVLPVLGPLIGLDITADMVVELGDHLMQLVSAAGGMIGLLMTIYGRTRATTRLVRREVRLMM